jgi:hypothetical protein
VIEFLDFTSVLIWTAAMFAAGAAGLIASHFMGD